MYQANVPEDIRYRVCKEALQCATMLDNAVVIVINGVKGTRYQHFYDEMPGFVSKLRTWGEAGVVKTKVNGTPKLSNRGVVCIFV